MTNRFCCCLIKLIPEPGAPSAAAAWTSLAAAVLEAEKVLMLAQCAAPRCAPESSS